MSKAFVNYKAKSKALLLTTFSFMAFSNLAHSSNHSEKGTQRGLFACPSVAGRWVCTVPPGIEGLFDGVFQEFEYSGQSSLERENKIIHLTLAETQIPGAIPGVNQVTVTGPTANPIVLYEDGRPQRLTGIIPVFSIEFSAFCTNEGLIQARIRPAAFGVKPRWAFLHRKGQQLGASISDKPTVPAPHADQEISCTPDLTLESRVE